MERPNLQDWKGASLYGKNKKEVELKGRSFKKFDYVYGGEVWVCRDVNPNKKGVVLTTDEMLANYGTLISCAKSPSKLPSRAHIMKLKAKYEMNIDPRGEDFGKPGWVYRDLSNMLPEYWNQLMDILGQENVHLLAKTGRAWPDKTFTVRGQLLVSPEGMERLRKHNAD